MFVTKTIFVSRFEMMRYQVAVVISGSVVVFNK